MNMYFTEIKSYSSLDWSCLNLNYMNSSRNFPSMGFQENFYTPWDYCFFDIMDCRINNKTLMFLTEGCQLSTIINAYYPSNENELLSGTSYSDLAVSNQIVSSINPEFQGIFTFNVETSANQYNIIPLNDFGYVNINYNINEKRGTDNIVMGKNIDCLEYTFQPDISSKFFLDEDIEFNDIFKFGNANTDPCYSDIFWIDLQKTSEFSGISGGNYLYSWLSGDACSREWMNRYSIDTNHMSSLSAHLYIDSFLIDNYVDLPIEDVNPLKKADFYYYRMGPERNGRTLDMWSSYLISGIYLDKIWEMDGTDSISWEISSPESFYENIQENITFSCLFKNDETGGVFLSDRGIDDTSGLSFLYNTGFTNETITILEKDGSVSTFNKNSEKIASKVFTGSNVKCNLIASVAHTGFRWILDQTNNIIHRLDLDNISLFKIELSADANISHMECDRRGDLWIMDIKNEIFQRYNLLGALTREIPFSAYSYLGNRTWDMFYIPIMGFVPIPTMGVGTDFDSEGNLYRITGRNIRKNDDVFYHIGKIPSDMFVDLKNNVWVVYENRLLKIDSYGKKIFDKKIAESWEEFNPRINGWVEDNEYAYVYFIDNNILFQIDENGTVVQYKEMNSSCSPEINIFRGDWTGFKQGKRQNYIDHTHFKGFASPENPFITLTFTTGCPDRNEIYRFEGNHTLSVPYKPYSCWNYWNGISFVLDNSRGFMGIYINGDLAGYENFGKYSRKIKHDYIDTIRYNPLITGKRPGKIGTIDNSLGIVDGALKGKMGGIRLYSKGLSGNAIQAIYKHDSWILLNQKNFLPLKVKVPGRSYNSLVKLDKFQKNAFPGMASNAFDINVYGWDDSWGDDIRERLQTEMEDVIFKIKPVHTYLRKINWK